MTSIKDCYAHWDGVRSSVVAWGLDGAEYTHERDDLTLFQAEKLSLQVRDAGEIDPAHWGYRAPYGTEAYVNDGEEERLAYLERYCGFGEGVDDEHDFGRQGIDPFAAW